MLHNVVQDYGALNSIIYINDTKMLHDVIKL